MSERKYVPIGIQLVPREETVDPKTLVLKDPNVARVINAYKSGEFTLGRVHLKQSTYHGLTNYLIDKCAEKLEDKFNIYEHLFQLMEMSIANACVAYLYKEASENIEIMSLLSKSDSFEFGFRIMNQFLTKFYVYNEETDDFYPFSSDEKILMMHCCVLISDIYQAFSSNELIDMSDPSEVEDIFKFLEEELDAKNQLDIYIREHSTV